MKTIQVPADAVDVDTLLATARDEDVLIRSRDGTEFLLTAIDEFDQEIARTRQSAKLMALLDERAKAAQSFSLQEVRTRLDLK